MLKLDYILRAEGSARQHNTAAISLKKTDGEPLLREDIQYDFLEAIFNDQTVAFSDQSYLYPTSGKTPLKVNFSQLYINALLNSTKLSRVLKEKMLSHQDFALEFSKIALLVNIGRINTTMACTQRPKPTFIVLIHTFAQSFLI
jgi:Ino eighty subunit 1